MNRPVTRARRGLCWGTIPQASAVELIRAAADHGFAAVTLSQVAHADVLDDGGRAVRALCAATGVAVDCVEPIIGPLPGLAAPSEVPADLAVFLSTSAERAVRIAECVEARSVNVAHFLGRPVDEKGMVEAIARVAELASRHDLRTTVEFIPGTGIADLASAAGIVAAIDSPDVGVLLDVWHLARSGGDAADIAALPPQTLGGMQICDRIEPTPGAPYVPMSGRLMPGDGQLPLDAILLAALTNSPGLTVCVEVFDPAHSAQSIGQIADRAAASMRSLGFR